MSLPHPAMRRTDRLFQIINPAACAIARPQAPGDLELTPGTFGTGKRSEARHSHSHRSSSGAVLGSPSVAKELLGFALAAEIIRRPKSNSSRAPNGRCSLGLVQPYQGHREGQLPIFLGSGKARAKLAVFGAVPAPAEYVLN